MGFLFLSNFEAKKALEFFLQMEKKDLHPESYNSRIGRIGTCDAIAATGDYSKALKKLATIHARPEVKLLQGILMQVRGEYYARAKIWKKAKAALDLAETFFPEGDQSYDRAILMKWQAVTLFNLGNHLEAKKLLKTLFKNLYTPQNRPEMWLDCYRWMNEFKFLTVAEQRLLWSYPGVPDAFAKDYQKPSQLTIGPSTPKIWLSSKRNEYKIDGQIFTMMPKQLELLELLVRSGPFGLSAQRACSILWPTELGNFVLLEDRLQKLQRRLRNKFKMEIYSEEKIIRLGKAHFDEVAVEVIAEDSHPLIFKTHSQVGWREVQTFYQLGKTQSFKLLKTWLEREWTVKVGPAKDGQFRIRT